MSRWVAARAVVEGMFVVRPVIYVIVYADCRQLFRGPMQLRPPNIALQNDAGMLPLVWDWRCRGDCRKLG